MNANNGLIPLALGNGSRLASDVVRSLLGIPQPRHLSLRSFYLLLDTGLATLSLYQIWSFVQSRTYRAVLPTGYNGQFGPGVKA